MSTTSADAPERASRGTIRLVGVPMDLGAGRRGVDMGPSAIRIAGIRPGLERLGYRVEDDGDVGVPAPETRDPGPPSARYLEPIYHVCNRLRLRVRRTLESGHVPVVLGGDHSIAIGTVSGVAEYHHDHGDKIGLIWVDAHADMNTPDSSPTGNIHGMPLATLLGKGHEKLVGMGGFVPKVEPRHVCLIGIRDIDATEREIVKASGIHAYTMRDVDERGIRAILAESIGHVTDGTAGFHVSFDLDGMDPTCVPGTGTPVKGGIDWREANLLMEMVSDTGRMLSLEITELNPILDVKNQSGEVAVDLVLSAFGKRIL
ncbi:MAG: arginase [Planctomycetes bacterium]|nr:arginase [Planctomycetota bacterium]